MGLMATYGSLSSMENKPFDMADLTEEQRIAYEATSCAGKKIVRLAAIVCLGCSNRFYVNEGLEFCPCFCAYCGVKLDEGIKCS